jgi:hypothetical protein
MRRTWYAEGDTESGAGAPPAVDWASVTVPEDVIKNHPAYKAVLTESIQRRQELAELKKPKEPVVTDAPKDEDRFKALEEKLEAMALENQAKNRSITVATVAATHKIPAELHNLITGDTAEEIAASAALIAKYIKVEQAAPPPANPAGPSEDKSLLKAVMDRMTQGNNLSPFDPGFQRQLGG